MKKRTLTQNKQFHTLCAKIGLDADQKANLVKHYTLERHTSSAEMSMQEMKACLIHLNTLVGESDEKRNKMRRKVIALLCTYDAARFTLNDKPNMPAILVWLKEGKHLAYKGVGFNDLSVEQLQVVITQIEKIRKDRVASSRKKMEVVK